MINKSNEDWNWVKEYVLIEDDKFSVTLTGTYTGEPRFIFGFTDTQAQDYFNAWYREVYLISMVNERDSFGYSKQSVRDSITYLKEKGIELSLETGMWLIKEKGNG